MFKRRPIRIFKDNDEFYYLLGGKKKRLINKQGSTLSQLQKKFLSFQSNIKLIPLTHISQIKKPEDLDEYLIALRKNDPKAYKLYLEQKALGEQKLSEEEKQALNVLEQRRLESELEEEKKRKLDDLENELFTITPDDEQRAINMSNSDSINGLLNTAGNPIPMDRLLEKNKLKIITEKIMNYLSMDIYDFFEPFDNYWNGTIRSNFNDRIIYLKRLFRVLYYLNQLSIVDLRDVLTIRRNPFSIGIDDRTKNILLRKFLLDLSPNRFSSFVRTLPQDIKDEYQLETISNRISNQLGLGNKKLPALYNDEIEDYFANKKIYPDFAGVIASDEINLLPKKIPLGFIMNLDKHNEGGSHWIAVYINGDSLEYYDPFGNQPSEDFIKRIKKFITELQLPILLKFKINNIKDQDERSHRCGYHCIRFLDDRFNGIPFKLSSRFINNSKQGEGQIKKEFSYV
jgi:hypothetical protein